MCATLQDHAPNTYYGHWLAKNAGKHPAKRGAIARNELVASPGGATFSGAERDFPGNRWPTGWKFVRRAKRKICAPGEGRFQRRPPLLSKGNSALVGRTSRPEAPLTHARLQEVGLEIIPLVVNHLRPLQHAHFGVAENRRPVPIGQLPGGFLPSLGPTFGLVLRGVGVCLLPPNRCRVAGSYRE